MYFSPKTSADGLVFHYDTGNTVRSYIGEPTVNLYEELMNLPASWSIGPNTSYVGTTEGPFPSTVGYKYSVLGSGNFYLIYSKSGLTPNTTYTVSVYVKMIVGTSTQNNGVLYSTDYNAGIPPSTNITSEWKRIHYTFTLGANSTYANVVLFGYDNAVGNILAYSLPQLEQKSHPTQHIDGTRSVTQGLKDLTAVNTIDLSSVSFDSNAQMVFDGTDDFAITSNFPQLSNWSTELVLKPAVFTSSQRVILDVNLGIRFEISNGFFNSHFGDGNGWIYTNLPSTTQIAANKSFHIVVTVQSGGQARVYVNGILENSINIGSGTTPSLPLYIGRFTGATGYEFNGEIPVAKIYNRALTADEVARNFNAVKSRFNIA